MFHPKVSVIIPVYNAEKTLRQCLASVVRQTYDEYEIIIVDNRSTDGTKAIIEAYTKEGSGIHYVFEKERGVGAARSTGEKIATGEIILMTDADCIVPEDWIQEMIQPFANVEVNAVQGSEEPWGDDFWSRNIAEEVQRKYCGVSELQGEAILCMLDTKNFGIRRAILESFGNTPRIYQNGNDTMLSLYLSKAKGAVVYLKNVKVKHFHVDTLAKLVKKQFVKGAWTRVVYLNNKAYLRGTHFARVTNQTLLSFIKIFPGLLLTLLRLKFGKFFYDCMSGLAWRAGILWYVSVRKQTQTKY